MSKILAGAILVLALSAGARADLLIGWDVNGLAGNEPFVTAAFVAPNIVTTTTLVRGPGLLTSAATNTFSAGSWTVPSHTSTVADAVASNDYFSVKIIADPGYYVDITNFSIRTSRSNQGPTNYAVRSSADGFTSDLDLWTSGATQNRSITVNITGETEVEFRFYGYGALAIGGVLRVADGASFGSPGIDVAIFGTVSVIPEPGTAALFASGLGLAGILRRRKRRV